MQKYFMSEDTYQQNALFAKLQLEGEMLDSKGDKKYPVKIFTNKIQRGGFTYSPPYNCTRYGLNVKYKYKQYPNWLGNDGSAGEWAVAYYVLKFPRTQNPRDIQNLAYLNHFFKKLANQEAISQDKQQPFEMQENLLCLGSHVGKGVYCYRKFNLAFNSTAKITFQNVDYRILIQCRVNPASIRLPNDSALYVVAGSQNVRPYGIILDRKSIANPYQQLKYQFPESPTKKPKNQGTFRFKSLRNVEINTKRSVRTNKEGKRQIVNSVNFQQAIRQAKRNDQCPQVSTIIQQIYRQNKDLATQICNEVINAPITEQQKREDEKITKKMIQEQENSYKKDIKKDSNLVILCLKQKYSRKGAKVTIQQNSSLKSQISLKALTTGLFMDRIKVTQALSMEDFDFDFEFILKDQSFLQEFENWYLERMAKQLKIDKKQISIHNITKGSNGVQVEWSTSKIQQLKNANSIKQKLTLKPYFQQFFISPQDFDPKGNRQFEDECDYIAMRGGYPYYQPILATRYGLKVRGRYQNDDWLQMDDNPGQWAIAFHGVRSPEGVCNNGKKVLESIFSGIKQGNMLRAGENQVHKDDEAVNRPKSKVGTGIYCSPQIKQCLYCYTKALQVAQSQFDKGRESLVRFQKYHLVFQCRVNPRKLKVPISNQQYWVVNQPQDIRPYGIILVTEENAQKIPYPDIQFKQFFCYEKYRQKTEYFLSKQYRQKFQSLKKNECRQLERHKEEEYMQKLSEEEYMYKLREEEFRWSLQRLKKENL